MIKALGVMAGTLLATTLLFLNMLNLPLSVFSVCVHCFAGFVVCWSGTETMLRLADRQGADDD